ncbi:hypothetical protein [Arenimonas sp.]|uniref:hypothetical protein n=1 Tax=Arenimonas sp. TaxID=1872635 RepID=UPI0039E6543A
MCKASTPKPPPVVERDPVKEAADAANESQGKANAEIAMRRKKLRMSSLFTVGARGLAGSPTNTAFAQAVSRSNPTGGVQ